MLISSWVSISVQMCYSRGGDGTEQISVGLHSICLANHLPFFPFLHSDKLCKQEEHLLLGGENKTDDGELSEISRFFHFEKPLR